MKNITSYLLTRLSSGIHSVRKRKSVEFVSRLKSRQWLSAEKLAAICDEQTLKLIRHAGSQVPYYRKLFHNMGLSPDHFDLTRDWERVPLLDKSDLAAHFEELKSDGFDLRQGYVNHSGGSTGVPVKFVTDYHLHRLMVAWLDFVFSWAGWKPGEIRLDLWGDKGRNLPLTLWERIRASIAGHIVLPVFNYTEATMHQWFRVVQALSPTIIYGYPSVLADFADWIESENRVIKSLKGVFSSGEILYPQQRELIQKVFNCKVFNQYGSRETPCVACECPEGGMHIFTDINRVEFVADLSKKKENKEIIVTPLFNYAQPLLRYRLNDLGMLRNEACVCGRGYPLMEVNVARSRDIIKAPNGANVFPGFFARLMDGRKEITCYQFVHKRNDLMVLNVQGEDIDTEDYCCQLESELKPLIIEKMGDVRVKVNVVKKIDRSAAGKHRYVISEVDSKNGK